MGILTLLYYSLLYLALLLVIKLLLPTRRLKNLPPGPTSLPIIGNLHYLKKSQHITFHNLSKKYGDIFSVWFGKRLVVVVSSQSLALECLTKNDMVLASRPQFISGKYYVSLGSSPYGSTWRNLRRITMLDVLSTNRLNSFSEIRKDETKRLLQTLAQNSCEDFARVELSSKFYELTFNNIMRMISGKRYSGEDCDVSAREFREVLTELLQLLGASNHADFLPILRWFDFDNLEKRLETISKTSYSFLTALIEEHRSRKEPANTMIDHLLSLQETEPQNYTDHTIKGLVLGTLFAGTDSSAQTLDWAMTNLLNHPEILKKAQSELDTHVGQDRLVDESDVPKLSYLQNILFETLRLHPPAPLLLPHLSLDNCNIGGYTVPRDTMVMINVWAIHRDPRLWTEATCFKPERFEKEGESKKLLAFGLGRRACPGEGLAIRAVSLTLGLLIQCFEWKRVSAEKIDVAEKKGFTLAKSVPIEAMCKARPVINMVMK